MLVSMLRNAQISIFVNDFTGSQHETVAQGTQGFGYEAVEARLMDYDGIGIGQMIGFVSVFGHGRWISKSYCVHTDTRSCAIPQPNLLHTALYLPTVDCCPLSYLDRKMRACTIFALCRGSATHDNQEAPTHTLSTRENGAATCSTAA
jgi:hypothetical protein